ncbi:MAG: peptide ABC transporter substrate-binding protein [Verrucomicrobia bacterium]|nr:peptide ABC transporter substrate-binding protein [Verrucomicrobiota bacterium]MDA1066637.1 peptide ABC transporter substrate-binding protein [Verrucomicrobiota bacterium]
MRPITAIIALLLVITGCNKGPTLAEKSIASQSLHVGNGQEPQELDPHIITGITEIKILSALYEGLTGQDPHNLNPTPAAAESWDISEDGKSYTFNLRNGLTWSNGDPLSAGDFEYAFQRILTPRVAASNAYLLFVIKNAKNFHNETIAWDQVGVKTIDDKTLIIELENPTPYFLKLLAHPAWYPLHKESLSKTGDPFGRATGWTHSESFISNGPFTLSAWKVNEFVHVTRNEKYWDNLQSRLNEIFFYPTESREAEERSFRAGQLHVTEAVPVSKVGFYRDRNETTLQIDPYLGTYYLQLNTRKPPLSDPRVRRALSLVIDRSMIVNQITQGMQQPAWHFTPPGAGGYDPGISFEKDIEQATTLLSDAGFPGGTGFPELTYLYNTSENNKAIAVVLQQMWKASLGIQVELINQELKVVNQSRESGEFDILKSSWIGDYDDPGSFLDVWTSESGNNFTGWSSAAYDGLVGKSRTSSSTDDRFNYFKTAEELLIKEQPILPLYFYTSVYLKHPAIRGYYPTLLNYHPWKHVYLEAPVK